MVYEYRNKIFCIGGVGNANLWAVMALKVAYKENFQEKGPFLLTVQKQFAIIQHRRYNYEGY